MQTFLPYPDFKKSAEVLDNRRLGKQRVETYQILRTLLGISQGWKNHPAVKMWRGCERALAEYGMAMCTEWIRRGCNDTCLEKIAALTPMRAFTYPVWFGDDAFHASHRSNLMRKSEHYHKFGWTEPHDLPYVWPSLLAPEACACIQRS